MVLRRLRCYGGDGDGDDDGDDDGTVWAVPGLLWGHVFRRPYERARQRTLEGGRGRKRRLSTAAAASDDDDDDTMVLGCMVAITPLCSGQTDRNH